LFLLPFFPSNYPQNRSNLHMDVSFFHVTMFFFLSCVGRLKLYCAISFVRMCKLHFNNLVAEVAPVDTGLSRNSSSCAYFMLRLTKASAGQSRSIQSRMIG
jgi:hypothetical protein